MKFLSELDVRVCGDRDFVLISPLVYQDDAGTVGEVAAGQHVDFGSVWGIPFASLLLAGRYNKIFTVHDDDYRNGKIPRIDADKKMRAALVSAGMCPALAAVVYRAVRIGGRSSYKGKPERNN
jgi:hypothetical protein